MRTPRSTSRTFLLSLVLYNPLFAAAITFALGGSSRFFETWLVNLVISEVVAIQCFAVVNLVRVIEIRVARARRRPVAAHGLGWYLALAGTVMLPSLPLAFALGGFAARALGGAWNAPDLGSYRLGIAIGCVVMLFFFFQRARADAEARLKDLEAARLRAQLSALTAEMNPHLLFNALNTVASLIHRDPDRAEDVVLQLADLYRGVLRTSGAATHALADEIALCDAYLKIEQARFGARLSVDIAIAPDLDPSTLDVPVLVVQPFVENAVKHGISPRAKGGHIALRVDRHANRLRIAVEDDGVGFGQSTYRGNGKAIANCEERLRLAFTTNASVDVGVRPEGGTRVLISLPIGGTS